MGGEGEAGARRMGLECKGRVSQEYRGLRVGLAQGCRTQARGGGDLGSRGGGPAGGGKRRKTRRGPDGVQQSRGQALPSIPARGLFLPRSPGPLPRPDPCAPRPGSRGLLVACVSRSISSPGTASPCPSLGSRWVSNGICPGSWSLLAGLY